VSRRLLLLFGLLGLAGLLLFVQLPIPPTYAGRTIENAGHTPLFALITLALLAVMQGDHKFAGAKLYGLAGLTGVGVGLLTELIQEPLRRDASWEDVFADAIGVVCALALYALFDRRNVIPRLVRFGALVVAVVCIAAYLAPIVRMTRAYLHRNGQFPVLADYRSSIELYWIVGYGINRDLNRGALEVDFEDDKTPGVSLHEPVPDWRDYHTLVLDVENPDTQALKLGVRVHDQRHGKVFVDRFNRLFDLAAGQRQQIRIALDDVRRGPRDRLMDMGHISDITLFRGEPTGSRHLRVYSLRLE